MANQNRIPIPTLTRFANLYRVLQEAEAEGVEHLNSAQLEALTSISASQIRKDLSMLGEMGRPGVGYKVNLLKKRIGSILRVDRGHPYALVGAGQLGRAIANYPGFEDYGFKLKAIFDSDREKVGQIVQGIPIESNEDMPSSLLQKSIRIAVLTVPRNAAQDATDQLVAGGVRWILNFAPTHLKVPDNCIVRDVFLTPEFAILGHFTED